jgi:L-fuconolactonase
MFIDAHQHFWQYTVADYPWIDSSMERLARDYLPADLTAVALPEGVTGSVAVQARQTVQETDWLLSLAASDPFIRGVVGWVDLRSPTVTDDLRCRVSDSKLVGVRHVVQDEPDPRFLLQDDFVRGLKALEAFHLTYDLLLFPHQLPAAIELAALMPDQPFVLDHLAKPQIKVGKVADWEADIKALARHQNVFCKLSGLVTEADWDNWSRDDFRGVLDVALTAFGPDRLLFGSDWPVCLLAADYHEVVGIVSDVLATLSHSEQTAIRGETATRFYGLPQS